MGIVNTTSGLFAGTQNYTGVERRTKRDRRQRLEQRNNVRFDKSGGDRRSMEGRRRDDIGFQLLM